ncbi:hypothetical protein G5C64_16775 [Vibrio diabolicus]|uniref:hypothetical protein n=1 Tax=Vibrio diabolicus TaxID=50719 RepID=UPI002150D82F|nr:hypothetical protein [Vibrio diabolicus]MCE3220478.1 hypothetical protein [Vibrio diabolicus]
MKKLLLLTAIGSAALLSGCQMTGSTDNASTPTNFQDMSCQDIKSTLDAQKEAIDTIESGGSLLSMVGMDEGTDAAKKAAVTTYQTSLKAAKPIAKAKKCKFSL